VNHSSRKNRLQQSLLVLCSIVLAVVLMMLRRTHEQKTAIDVLIENGKESLSSEELDRIEGLEDEFKRSEAVESLRALKREWQKADNQQIEAFYAFRIANEDSTFSSWKEAGLLLDSASRSPAGELNLQDYFLRCAIDCLEQAQALDQSDTETKIALAGLYADGQGAVMRGVMLLREVLASDSLNVHANLKLGELSMVSGQYENAIARFLKVTSADTGNTHAWVGLGQAYVAAGNEPRAIEALTRATSLMDSSSQRDAVLDLINELKN
jgi:tetratricopeptide (TPR) repeat protein